MRAVFCGDLWLAFRYNALICALPFLLAAAWYAPERVRKRMGGDALTYCVVLLLGLFTLVRNLPGFSFLRVA